MLVDDHPVLRHGMIALINTQNDLEVVAETGDVEAVMLLVSVHRPDVVLMDLDLGGEVSGIDLTAQVTVSTPGTRVLVFTTYDSDADIVRAIDAGSIGYLLKDSRPAELFEAIRSAARGVSVLSPTVATRLLGRMQMPDKAFTAREIEVLQLLVRGHSNRELSKVLLVSESTVKTHLHHIFTKLGVDSRGAAIAQATRTGIVRA